MVGTHSKNSMQDRIPLDLSTPETRLFAIIQALQLHYEKSDDESQKAISSARKELGKLLHNVPPGITYLTLEAKEGIYALTASLQQSSSEPVYAIKRFKTFEQAQHVNWLSHWLTSQRAITEAETGAAYFNTPETFWPLEVNGYSALFFTPVVGEDLVSLMPKVNAKIKRRSEDAVIFKREIILAALDNVAYFQSISPRGAKKYKGNPQAEVETFITTAIAKSAATLEAITDASLTSPERRNIAEAADAMLGLISHRYALGLDAGPRNIMITKDPEQSVEDLIASTNESYRPSLPASSTLSISEAVQHVDLPSEWKYVHEMREAVRLLFHSVMEIDIEEAHAYLAYLNLRARYIRAETAEERRVLSGEVGILERGTTPPKDLRSYSDYVDEGPYDLSINVAAEAARMTVVIPRVFMAKELGVAPARATPASLTPRYHNLEAEVKHWARQGLNAVTALIHDLPTPDLKRVESLENLQILSDKWESATINPRRIPAYTDFMDV